MAALLLRKERECLSYRALEEETGISRNTLAAWATRLRRESARGERSAFVELVASDDGEAGDIGIEVVIGGHVLRVRRGFDEATLRRVLTLLSSC